MKDQKLSPELLAAVDAYIRENYMPPEEDEILSVPDLDDLTKGSKKEKDVPKSRMELSDGQVWLSDEEEERSPWEAPEDWNDIHEVVNRVGETFRQMLFRLIRDRKMTEIEVYQKAQVDRKLFSKIRRNEKYIPHKETILALAFALRLNLDETKDLLSRAGQALSPGSKADLIVEYCIRNQIYDLFKVNEILYEYGEPTLP